MRTTRAMLLLAGLAFVAWGAWSLRDVTGEELVSLGAWLLGSVVLHDLLLAPLSVALGLGAARVLPAHARRPAAVAFLVWAALTVAFVNVLSGQGGKPDNPTLLGRPYGWSWVALSLVLLLAAVLASYRRRPRHP